MSVRLRPHHLFCVLTYVGRGYDSAFAANMSRVVRRLAQGEALRIVDGPDDICAPLTNECSAHCSENSVTRRDAAAARLAAAALNRPVRADECLHLSAGDWDRLRGIVAADATETAIETVCGGCVWRDLCRSVAAKTFAETELCAVRAADPA